MEESEPFDFEKNESTTVGIKSLQTMTYFLKHRIQPETKKFNCELSSLNQFKCQFCGFETSLKLTADRHKALVHRPPGCSDPEVQLKRYGCHKCDFETYSLLVLARHNCVEDSTIPEKCPCKSYKIIKLMYQLNYFNCESSNLNQFECQFCGFKTCLKLAADRHKALVHRPRECSNSKVQLKCYGCNKCDFKTYSLLVLARHNCVKDSTIPDETVEIDECEKCPSKSYKIVNLNHQLNYFNCESSSLNQFECQFCGFKTSLKLAADRHKALGHRPPGCSESEVQLKCYGCNKCAFKTYSLLVLARHNCVKDSTVPNETVEIDECEKCPSKSYKIVNLKHQLNYFNCESSSLNQFECQICGFKTSLKLAADRHKALVHRPRGCSDPEVQLKCYSCNKCDFKTYSFLVFARHHTKKDCLNKHFIRRHENPEIIKLRKAVNPHISNKHVKSKTIKCYKCEHCSQTMKTQTNLKNHILRRHTDSQNVNWFRCEHCAYKTKLKFCIKLHILNKHTDLKNIKWHKC